MTRYLRALVLSLILALSLGGTVERAYGNSAAEKMQSRVFEIRTYTTPPGKLDDLHKRFREHTMKIFERHGMTNVAYWTPQDEALASTTLIYVLSHDSREAAKKSWAAFIADPEWQRVRDASEVDGKIVTKVDSVFVEATDYSPLK